MTTRISNIAQLPEALRAGHESYFEPGSGDVKPEFWSTTSASGLGTYYAIGTYGLYSPTAAPYVAPPADPVPDPALVAARAQRDAAEVAVETALATYLAISSPSAADREPLAAAETRLGDCTELVTLLSS